MDSDIAVGKTGHLIINRHYDYDGVGNTTAITDKLSAANNKTFTFDSINELTGETWQGHTLAVGYDAFGNILSRSNSQGMNLTYNYNADKLTRLTGNITTAQGAVNLNQTFTYDAYGDITGMTQSRGATENFAYDNQSRLTSVSGTGLLSHQPVNVSHTYDGNGDQLTTTTTVSGKSTTELTLYGTNSQLLYQENLTKKTTTDYFSLNGHIIAKANHSAEKASTVAEAIYLHDDLLGSPLQQTNATGAEKWKEPQDYSPYGLERKVKTASVHVGFTGKLNNADTGISDFGARAYNPLLGRFMQQDPEAVHDVKPFSFNRYMYANNNPLMYKDPDGQWPGFINRLFDAVNKFISGTHLFDGSQGFSINGSTNAKQERYDKWSVGVNAFNTGVSWGIAFTAALTFPEGEVAAYGAYRYERYIEGEGKAVTSESNGASAATCFIKGTLIETEEGLIPIQTVAVGDKVASKDPVTGKIAFKPVVQLYHHHHKEILDLTLTNKQGHVQTLGVTLGHPFRDNKSNTWVTAGHLHIGEALASEHPGSLTVTGIKIDAKKQDTYNFEVKDFHTYFVGKDQAWVHNSCGPIKAPKAEEITGFPGLKTAKRKTPVQGGGGLRPRWKDSKGKIFEWDSRHGALEKYNRQGTHQGEFDPYTGEEKKAADKSRRVEP